MKLKNKIIRTIIMTALFILVLCNSTFAVTQTNHFSGMYAKTNGATASTVNLNGISYSTIHLGDTVFAAAWHNDASETSYRIYFNGNENDCLLSERAIVYYTQNGGESVKTNDFKITRADIKTVTVKFYCFGGNEYTLFNLNVEPQARLGNDSNFSSTSISAGQTYTSSITSNGIGTNYYINYKIEYYDGNRWQTITGATGSRNNTGNVTMLTSSDFTVPYAAKKIRATWEVENCDVYDIYGGRSIKEADVISTDTAGPGFSTSVLNGSTVIPGANITIICSDAQSSVAQIEYWWDSGQRTTVAGDSVRIPAPSSTGSHTLNVIAKDKIGNSNSMYYDYVVSQTKTLSSIMLSPGNITVDSNKTFSNYVVMAHYSDNSSENVTANAALVSNNTSVVSINGANLVSGNTAGTATLTATYGGQTTSSIITVNLVAKTLSSISLSPGNITVEANRAFSNYVIFACYADGTSENVTGSSTLTSSNPSIVSINGTNLTSGSTAGTALLTATYGGKTAVSIITVNAAAKTLSRITVIAPVTSGLTNTNFGQVTVTAIYSDGTTANVTSGTSIGSSNSNIVNIVGGYAISGSITGTAIITATYSGQSATCTINVGVSQKTYIDLPSTHWAYTAVMEMTRRGILDGFEDGTFRPDDKVTREQFAKVLVLSLNAQLKSPSTPTFIDVPNNYWSYQYVEAVKTYLTGYRFNDGLYFKGSEVAVREDMAVAIVNAKGLQNQTPDLTVLNQFYDRDMISQALKNHVAIAVKNGIIEGYGSGYLGPQNTLSRAEACALIYKANILSGTSGQKVVIQ